MTVTRRRCKCLHCGKLIETGEYQVVCQYYMKLKHSETVWKKTMRFHAKRPYCWVERAITELSTRPKPVETRGRHALQMSDEMKEKRFKILRRRAATKSRLEKELLRKNPTPERVKHLIDMLEKISEEIEQFGGLPKSWVVKSNGQV